MSHVKRLLVTDHIFFITVNLRKNCHKLSEKEYALLAAAIEESHSKLQFYWCGYVFMPDHWHALIGVKQALTISRAVQDIKWISARRINQRRQRTGPLWQHQFWDRFVRHETEFQKRLVYMHLNPVRKELTSHPKDWRWSSYGNYALEAELRDRSPVPVDYIRFS